MKIHKKTVRITRPPLILLLVVSISLTALPAGAYDLVVPGDLDSDLIVSDEELEAAQSSYDAGKITAEELAKIEQINENYPRTITDTAGREVTFYKPVERIITREPDTCRIVVALGEGDKVVASEQAVKSCLCPTTFGTFEEGCLECYYSILDGRMPDLPETSTRYDIYYELIASFAPDVIITSGTTNVQDFESKIGCPVVVAGGDGWIYSREDGLYGMIEVIGDVLEREEEAEELIGFVESEIDMISSVTETLDEDEKPKVYFAPRGAKLGFYDPKEGRDFTRTFTEYDPLKIAGGKNVAEGAEGYEINVAVEQIIAWNPDYIFIACSTPEDAEVIEWIVESPDLQSIAAVQNGNVYNCLYPHCRGRPADRSLINMVYMAKLLHPEKFEDLDLEKEGNEIFKAFLGVDGVFTEYADYLVWPREWLNSQ
ncbi:MAG: Periplasmic binding protein [Methanothrix harundinacea]|uniref:Periplasmic binding protein n=1 Tax=Methanothrix harundinacea TaxID=301375 RepID=A0A101FS55_9EURY|nr:MAG: Periplasmic binding protein [Methanothrix harundinacea]KUK94391.1 MAG: Periplasmic binding protein [Methanothrix harundinacea]